MNGAREHALHASADGYDAAKEAHARIHGELLDHHDRMGAGDISEHEAALRLLEADYPALKRGRASQQRRARREGERELDHEARRRTPQRTSSGGKNSGGGKSPQPRAQRATGAADRAAAATARASRRAGSRLASSASSAADVGPLSRYVLHLLGAGIALSLGYLLLTNAEKAGPGRSAIELGLGGVFTGFRALVSPFADPLSPARPLVRAAPRQPTPKPSVNPRVNPLAAGPPAPAPGGRVLPNYFDLLGVKPQTTGGKR